MLLNVDLSSGWCPIKDNEVYDILSVRSLIPLGPNQVVQKKSKGYEIQQYVSWDIISIDPIIDTQQVHWKNIYANYIPKWFYVP